MSIRAKIILSAGIAIFLGIAMYAAQMMSDYIPKYNQAMMARGEAAAHNIQSQFERLIALGIAPKEAVGFDAQMNEMIKGFEELRSADILTRDGEIVISTDKSLQGRKIKDPSVLEAVQIEMKEVGAEGARQLIMPIRKDGRAEAFVRINLDEAVLNRSLVENAVRGTLFVVADITLALFLLYFALHFMVTKRISGLIGTIQDIRDQKDLSRQIEVTSGDEIGQLARAFNEVNAQLAASYAGLEQKVAETEKLNSLMVGREIRMVEMKEERAKLEAELAKLRNSK